MLVNAKTGEIFIYDAIGQDWYGGGITAEAVIVALDQLDGKRATVRINSPGGVADEGIAIYNAIKRYPGGADTVVDSLAASAASIVALAGQSRITAKGGRWMIHRAMAVAVGNAVDMARVSALLDTYDRSLVEIYQQYLGKTANVMDLLTAETWYTSDEAVFAGLSTGKAEEDAIEPNVAAWFRNPPKSLLERPAAKFAVRRQAAALRRSVVR